MVRMTTTQKLRETAKPRSMWAVLLPWALVVLLAVSNFGTLISARVHTAGSGALESVLATIAPSFAERVLSRSSTRMAERQARLARNIAARSTGRLATHAARSIASIPERVLPVVGTAAVVGFTLYDVQTDCATAADMNEILVALGQEPMDAGPICRLSDKVPSPFRTAPCDTD